MLQQLSHSYLHVVVSCINKALHSLSWQTQYVANAQFGWIGSGAPRTLNKDILFGSLITDVEKQIARFWEIEEIEVPKLRQSEQEEREEHFCYGSIRTRMNSNIRLND